MFKVECYDGIYTHDTARTFLLRKPQTESIHNIFPAHTTVPSRVHLKHLPEGMVSDISQSSPLFSASCFSEVSSDTIKPGFGAKIAEVTTALCASERESNFD